MWSWLSDKLQYLFHLPYRDKKKKEIPIELNKILYNLLSYLIIFLSAVQEILIVVYKIYHKLVFRNLAFSTYVNYTIGHFNCDILTNY